MTPRLRPAFAILLSVLLLVSACSTVSPKSVLNPPRRAARNEGAQRRHPEFNTRIKSIRRIGILPPRVRAYQVVNNVRETMDEWAENGRKGALRELGALAKERPDRFVMITPDDSLLAEYEDMMSLYETVSSSILDHTEKDKDLFYEKYRVFDYSVGSVTRLLDRHQVDALVVTQVKGAIIKKTIEGSARVGIVTAALIDRNGALLCYADSERLFGMDMRSADSVKQSTGRAVRNLLREGF